MREVAHPKFLAKILPVGFLGILKEIVSMMTEIFAHVMIAWIFCDQLVNIKINDQDMMG